MTSWLGRSLNRKLSFLLLVSILVPLLSLGYFSYTTASDVTEEKAKQAGMSILRQIDTNLEFVVKDIENMSLFLIGNKEVQQYLSNKGDDAVKQTQMIEFLSNLVYSKPYISDITIYPKYKSHPVSNTTILQSGLPDITQKEPDYFEAHPRWWSSVYENHTNVGVKRVISLVRPVRNMFSFEQIGMLVISLDEQSVARMLKQSVIEGDDYTMLVDSEGRILSSGTNSSMNGSLEDFLPGLMPFTKTTGSVNYGEQASKKTILYLTVPDVNWTLVRAIPYAEYRSQNRYVLALTAVSVGLAGLLIASLVVFFVKRVTRPLLMLTHFLKDTDPEEPIQPYPVESMDEVGQLVRSYNKLGGRIERLTEQVKHNESLKKEADMQALQAQINPHFLYNTLSSIHWMALMNEDMKTANMVGSLSDFLRFSLNKGAPYCPVEQEIAHARHYANIQSIRYPDKFEIRFFVDPAMHGRMMLKLLLQPLIENALIHGIQKREGKGVIHVHAVMQGATMNFVVDDTGTGMEPDRLSDVLSRLYPPDDREQPIEQGSYGLRNVHQRLLLHYGNEAGLTIESMEGIGTRVTFTIPVMEES
ncbi:sensor histidine kinase [Paenibacillus alkaliterrae]|uniref:sensor histidine kinase n=1 Tax=Paenibacillus alkaliterrae TaxID=320909 RepID=UPI001F2A80D5|nr:sensor histidine kinase [Paenibacillus alkaliterrae]MCF2938037.1 sensor histidine kinase [Paenibacillus alkaliterrae]